MQKMVHNSYFDFLNVIVCSQLHVPTIRMRLDFLSTIMMEMQFRKVSRQLVYGHFVYDTSSTDISSTMTFLAEIEAGVI